MGGRSFSTLPSGPSDPVSTPRSRRPLTTRFVVARSVSSAPTISPAAADVADGRVGLRQLLQPSDEVLAGDPGVLDQALLVEHIQHSQPCRCGNWVSTEGGEETGVALEFLQQRPPRDNYAQRVAITNRLSQRHDVGVVPTSREAPKVRPRPPQAKLHFIANDEPPSLPHCRCDGCDPLRRRVINTGAGEGAVNHQRRRFEPALLEARYRALTSASAAAPTMSAAATDLPAPCQRRACSAARGHWPGRRVARRAAAPWCISPAIAP